MKKRISVILCLVMALSFCLGAVSASAEEHEPVTLRMSWWGGEDRAAATLAAVDAFMEKYPWITVECEYANFDGWQEKCATQLAGGTAPDLMQINWNWMYQFSSDGSKFVDLNEYTDIIDLSNYTQSQLDSMTLAGKLQGLPISMTSKLFFFNKTTFDSAGIALPTTWDELMAAGDTFQEKLGEDYYCMRADGWERMWLMCWYLQQTYGKPWVENYECQYTVEEVTDGLNFINELEAHHVFPTIYDYQNDGYSDLYTNPKWMSGQYAGIAEYDTAVTELMDSLNDDQEMVIGGYMTKEGAHPFGMAKVSMAFAVTESSQHKEEAVMLMNFLLAEDEGVKLMETQRGIPVNQHAKEVLEEAGLVDENVLAANTVAMENSAYSFDPNFEHADLKETTGVYYEVFELLSAGGDPAELAEYLIDSVNTVNQENMY